jgi:predicted TIM-barrel enzyme
VTLENAAQTLAVADGAIVSTSLMRDDAAPGDIIRWDSDKSHRFMDAIRAMPPGHGR